VPRPQASVPAGLPPGEGREKKSSRQKPRNPLKSLDSDERIQENPRKSNARERGLRSETATRQENPNGSTGPMARPDSRSAGKMRVSNGACSDREPRRLELAPARLPPRHGLRIRAPALGLKVLVDMRRLPRGLGREKSARDSERQ